MKAQWTISNHPEITGLNACAAKVLEMLQLDLAPTVRVGVGSWMAEVDVKKRGAGCRVQVMDGPHGSWFHEPAMPTTAEEMASALLFVVRGGVRLRLNTYTAASEALAAEDGEP